MNSLIFIPPQNIIMKMRWARRVAFMREVRNSYEILVDKTEGMRPL